ncbi:MAG: hypothetical protein K2F81_00575 [Ruminococcus sp.]|nr:hypothetical protein [Ruminococcus sp.]
MEVILLNGKTVEIKTKEELFKHFDNCRYPASDAANALGEGIIDNKDFLVLMRKIAKGDRNDH